jgi:hypothetical protein
MARLSPAVALSCPATGIAKQTSVHRRPQATPQNRVHRMMSAFEVFERVRIEDVVSLDHVTNSTRNRFSVSRFRVDNLRPSALSADALASQRGVSADCADIRRLKADAHSPAIWLSGYRKRERITGNVIRYCVRRRGRLLGRRGVMRRRRRRPTASRRAPRPERQPDLQPADPRAIGCGSG